jgi:hypothetical protein
MFHDVSAVVQEIKNILPCGIPWCDEFKKIAENAIQTKNQDALGKVVHGSRTKGLDWD